MESVKFVLLENPTKTALHLTPMIFNKDALAVLRTYGLLNVYLDDYGSSKKYKDCLFFLFKIIDTKEFQEFQHKIADFNSFYDYYDMQTLNGSLRMFVFKVHDIYRRDLFSFRHSRFDELSNHFLNIADEVDFTQVKLNVCEEIYRFSPSLEIIKEDL
jgi:hypothetical protein